MIFVAEELLSEDCSWWSRMKALGIGIRLHVTLRVKALLRAMDLLLLVLSMRTLMVSCERMLQQ